MSLVNVSDFIGRYTIAQTEQPNVAAVVQQYIDRYETEYLKKVLGVTMYINYKAGITASNPIYTALRDGDNYTDYYGETMFYEGLKQPILNYIYFHYLRDNVTFTTGSGEKEIQKGHAVSSIEKQVRAWNEMVAVNKKLRWYLYSKAVTFGNIIWYYNEMFHPINTLGL